MPENLPDGAKPHFCDGCYYPSHQAVDFYHHWKEDISLMAGMGFNTYCFSICWSRIFPTGDEESPNEAGLKFYDDIISELEKYHMEPLITIHHDELPVYLAETYDGWSSRHTNKIEEDGVECLGYTMWGPMDLVSLTTGEMKKRYGFIYVDMDDKGNGTLACCKNKSYDWMREVIATNGESLGRSSAN